MLSSMTGFASVVKEFARGQFHFLLRSVNHRYLDIQIRLPEEFRILEPALREQIAKKVARGKVECRILMDLSANVSLSSTVDKAALKNLLKLSASIQRLDPKLTPLSIGKILAWPGILQREEIQSGLLEPTLMEGLEEALNAWNISRQKEGQKIQAFLFQHSQKIQAIVNEIRSELPQVHKQYLQKLNQRLKEALDHVDHERIQQEFVLFAQRIDIEEEVERITIHLEQVTCALQKGGAIGKQLDFLMQELNREANTLSSKSVSSGVIHKAVDLKVSIEKMREQIQNIE